MSLFETAETMSLGSLGFGAAPIGNLYAEVSDDDAHVALAQAWRRGIRYFDTAPFYGHGLSERRLGDAFAAWPRAEFAVSTKVGRLIESDMASSAAITDGFAVSGSRAVFDYSRAGVRRSFEASLRRLRIDRVDILLLHDIGRLTHGERHASMLAQALDEALPEMARLRDEKLVGAIGIGVNEQEVGLEILPRFELDDPNLHIAPKRKRNREGRTQLRNPRRTRLGLDIGSSQALERYERWRRFDNLSLLAVTDVLNRLFSNDLPPVRLVRDLGLGLVDQIAPLKRLFMRHAMGVVGDLPRLVRGEKL